jgi:F-type H+-transporting ATPase subunit gamma
LIVVITSDRGLAGAFNTNVTKAVSLLLNGKYATQAAAGNVQLLTIGKKGNDFFARRKLSLNSDYATLFSTLNFNQVRKVSEFVMDGFLSQTFRPGRVSI